MASSHGSRIANLAHAGTSQSRAETTNFSAIVNGSSNSNGNSANNDAGDDDNDDDNDLRIGFESMLSLQHYAGNLQLLIRVVRAHELVNKSSFGGKQDPMLKISVGGRSQATDRQVGAGTSASFSDKFTFTFRASDYRNGIKINAHMLIQNVLGMDVSLGNFEQPVKDFIGALNKVRRVTMLLSPHGGYLTMKAKLINLAPLPPLTTEMIKSTNVAVATQVFLLLKSYKSEDKELRLEGGGGDQSSVIVDDDDFDLGDVEYGGDQIQDVKHQCQGKVKGQEVVDVVAPSFLRDASADNVSDISCKTETNVQEADASTLDVDTQHGGRNKDNSDYKGSLSSSELSLNSIIETGSKATLNLDDDINTSYDIPHLPFFETFFAVRGEKMKKPLPRLRTKWNLSKADNAAIEQEMINDVEEFDLSSNASAATRSNVAGISNGNTLFRSPTASNATDTADKKEILKTELERKSKMNNDGTDVKVEEEENGINMDDDDDDEFGFGDVEYDVSKESEDGSPVLNRESPQIGDIISNIQFRNDDGEASHDIGNMLVNIQLRSHVEEDVEEEEEGINMDDDDDILVGDVDINQGSANNGSRLSSPPDSPPQSEDEGLDKGLVRV